MPSKLGTGMISEGEAKFTVAKIIKSNWKFDCNFPFFFYFVFLYFALTHSEIHFGMLEYSFSISPSETRECHA